MIDTNILIRYLTRDEPVQSPRAQGYIDRLETGQVTATTCEAVLVETVQVLSSKNLYHLPRPRIVQYLTSFLRLRGLKLPPKRLYLRALTLYETYPVSFPDALVIVHAEQQSSKTVVSFDRGLDRVPGISREEP